MAGERRGSVLHKGKNLGGRPLVRESPWLMCEGKQVDGRQAGRHFLPYAWNNGKPFSD